MRNRDNIQMKVFVNTKYGISPASILSAEEGLLVGHLSLVYFDVFCGTWYIQSEFSLPHLPGQTQTGSSCLHRQYFYLQAPPHLHAMTKNMQGSDSYMS